MTHYVVTDLEAIERELEREVQHAVESETTYGALVRSYREDARSPILHPALRAKAAVRADVCERRRDASAFAAGVFRAALEEHRRRYMQETAVDA